MLGNIQLVRQAQALGGHTRAEDEFSVIEDENTEDATVEFNSLNQEG